MLFLLGNLPQGSLLQRALAAAGRELFAVSRTRRASIYDGDRLRKYLARFDLDFASVQAR